MTDTHVSYTRTQDQAACGKLLASFDRMVFGAAPTCPKCLTAYERAEGIRKALQEAIAPTDPPAAPAAAIKAS